MKLKKLAFTTTALMLGASVIFIACKKDSTAPATSPSGPQLVFVFKFDSTQPRLNNLGQPDIMPAGHSGLSPLFNLMSSHYVELAPTAYTALGTGDVLYRAPEVGSGASLAIDFTQSIVVPAGQPFLSVPLSSVTKGTYQYVRVSLAYQNYNIKFSAPTYGLYNLTGTIASFIGFNTHITAYNINTKMVTVNGNRAQGYWGFESAYGVITGQAPPGATTVPNPIFASSPIPQGSCVVTGAFVNSAMVATPLTITGNESQSDTIVVSLSTNKSFEWKDANGNGLYEPLNGDTVVDMGVRGMVPIIK
ncbi:MAG TPA: hypothetical protein VK806_05255 [Bacteroidia bacterium]|jgi:hypothetical protein|nr:hypothetical protein [Bacteroidia bacterium]